MTKAPFHSAIRLTCSVLNHNETAGISVANRVREEPTATLSAKICLRCELRKILEQTQLYVLVLAMVLPLAYSLGRRYFAVAGAQAPRRATLLAKKVLNHNSVVLKFQSTDAKLHLPVGKHFQLVEKLGENFVQRAYTPIALDAEKSQFDLLVKIYRPTERFPNGGVFSSFLDSLKIGDSLEMKGPVGRLEYHGNGEFELVRPNEPVLSKKFKKIGMIAGGTGIAPMYQVIKAFASEGPSSAPRAALLYGSQTIDDILLGKELASIPKSVCDVKLTVDRISEDENWNGFVGLIDKMMISMSLPKPDDETLILVCGPPMMNKIVKETLTTIGYKTIHVF